jgi:phosphoribosylformimino-5-aminoimidazole carboxamide ribotide isomerase
MIILPAIDLKDGKVVRMYKGDFDTVHQVAEDPVVTAQAFYDAGARYIHMVDLDGAKEGKRKNSDLVWAVAQVGLRIELGGGIRSMTDLEKVFGQGVYRAVIGSAAVSDPGLVKEAVETYGPDRIAVGIDARNGKVKTSGWLKDSGLDYLEFAKQMDIIGVKKIVFTDIETDGTLEGPAFSRLEALQQAVSCDIVASGGVGSLAHVQRLHAMNLYGSIIGKAIYAGTVDLAQAVREGGDQC